VSPAFVDNDGNFNWRKVGYHARSAFAVLLSIAVLAGGGYFVVQQASEAWTAFRTVDDYLGDGVDEVTVMVPPGVTVTQIGDILVEANVIKSTGTFRKVAAENPDSQTLQPGRYDLLTELPAEKALKLMLDPKNPAALRVTIPEGLALTRQWATIHKKLGEKGVEVSEETLKAAAVADGLSLPEWARGQLEGFMFPDTYAVAEPVTPTAIFTSQVTRFNAVATEIKFVEGAAALGMDPFDVVTIASIVEREVNQEEYRSKVSAVIQNRLAADMPLQMDSTVHFALEDFTKVSTTAADREVDSPYNTYKNTGLPPGAISNPGRAALEAAAKPADIDSLFFVTVDLDSGETRFAATLEEHNENVAVFQQWCQANEGRC